MKSLIVVSMSWLLPIWNLSLLTIVARKLFLAWYMTRPMLVWVLITIVSGISLVAVQSLMLPLMAGMVVQVFLSSLIVMILMILVRQIVGFGGLRRIKLQVSRSISMISLWIIPLMFTQLKSQVQPVCKVHV